MYELRPVAVTKVYWEFHLYYQESGLNGQVIGRICLFVDGHGALHLQLFKIDPAYQKQGHGRHGYQLLEQYIRTSTSFRTIAIQSTHSAQGFWLAMGYHPIYSFDDILVDMVKMI